MRRGALREGDLKIFGRVSILPFMNNGSHSPSMSDAPRHREERSSFGGTVRSVMRRVVRAIPGAQVGHGLDKHQVQAIFAAAEFAAETAVIQQFGHFDEFDPRLGAAYDRVFYALIAERCPDHKLDELVNLLNS